MTTISQVDIGSILSFDTHARTVLGTVFEKVVLEGVLTARVAAALGVDINAIHAQVYPYLPQGVPNDPYSYSWVRVRTAADQYVTIGAPYIIDGTIVVGNGGDMLLTFLNRSEAEMENIKAALASNNIRIDKTEIVTPDPEV